ncbi:MAG TPA: hypothetical protein PLV25_06105, partial [Opitutales bacterium]|nr:hypothetical protein [Opitutales bacterium]
MAAAALPADTATATSTESSPSPSSPQDPATRFKQAHKQAIKRGQSSGNSAALSQNPLKTAQELQAHYLNKFKDSALSEDENRTLAKLYAREYKKYYESKSKKMTAAALPAAIAQPHGAPLVNSPTSPSMQTRATAVPTHTAPDSPTAAVSPPVLPQKSPLSTSTEDVWGSTIGQFSGDAWANAIGLSTEDAWLNEPSLFPQSPPLSTSAVDTWVNAMLEPQGNEFSPPAPIHPHTNSPQIKPGQTDTPQAIPTLESQGAPIHPKDMAHQVPDTLFKEAHQKAIEKAKSTGRKVIAGKNNRLKSPEELRDFYLIKLKDSPLSNANKLTVAELYANEYKKAYDARIIRIAAARQRASIQSISEEDIASQDQATRLEQAQKQTIIRGRSAGNINASRQNPLKTAQELQAYYFKQYNNSALSESENRTLAKLYAREYKKSYEAKSRRMAADAPPTATATSTSTSTSGPKRPASALEENPPSSTTHQEVP